MALGTAAAIAAGANLLGGVIGAEQGRKQMSAADRARAQALAQYAGVELPDIEAQKLTPEEYQLMGEYAPEMEQYLGDIESRVEDIDPRMMEAQMDALEQMAGISEAGGLTDADLAALNQARRQAAGEAQAQQKAVLQNMAQRGMGGSGAELIARLQGAQAAADRLSQEGDRQTQIALQRQMDAARQSAGIGASAQSQELQRAQALEQIAKFNQQQQQALQQRNIGQRNTAQQQNLQAKQSIAQANVEARNRAQEANKKLLQNKFNNEMALAGAKAGQHGQAAQSATQRAGQEASMYAGIGAGLGDIFASTVGDKSKSNKD